MPHNSSSFGLSILGFISMVKLRSPPPFSFNSLSIVPKIYSLSCFQHQFCCLQLDFQFTFDYIRFTQVYLNFSFLTLSPLHKGHIYTFRLPYEYGFCLCPLSDTQDRSHYRMKDKGKCDSSRTFDGGKMLTSGMSNIGFSRELRDREMAYSFYFPFGAAV